ncbi:hypothetical protein BHE74_00039036 [Ensete ventricosum]|nr:hypothetical protein BHE74_00039036 [Ensete ventricosum]
MVGRSRLGSADVPEILASFSKHCVEIIFSSFSPFPHKVTCFLLSFISGVSCNKGAAAIGGRRGSDVHGSCRGGQQRYGARDSCCCVQFVASRDQDSWQRTIVAGCDENKLQRKIATGSFLPQGSLLVAIKEDDSKRSLLTVLGSERCMLRLKG